MTVRAWGIAGTLVLVLASAPGSGVLQAQENPVSVVELQALLDAYFITQAQLELQLSEEQYPQFLKKLLVLQNVRLKNEQERLKLIRDLNRLVNARVARPGQEGQFRERLKALDDLEISGSADFRTARDELAQTLTLRQQARLRLLEERMERQKLQLLLRARQRQAQQQGQQRQQGQ